MCHFLIAVTENKVYTMAIGIKNKLDDAICQRHVIKQGAFFQKAHGCCLRLCVRQSIDAHLLAQLAVSAQVAFASLKGLSVRHGIDAFTADIYDSCFVHSNSLVDVQKGILREER